MNPKVKAAWLEALRSGKYEQGYGQLRNGDRFCCLGVLCDVYRKKNGGRWLGGLWENEGYCLPNSVREWAGFSARDSNPQAGQASLAEYNDGKGCVKRKLTFPEIADLIEKHL